jgi:hypothetical protein
MTNNHDKKKAPSARTQTGLSFMLGQLMLAHFSLLAKAPAEWRALRFRKFFNPEKF